MEEPTTYEHIKYGCHEVVKLFIPVLVCMALVITNINLIGWFSVKDAFIIYTPFHEDSPEPTTVLWHAVANTFIFLSVIVAMTFTIVFLYKFGYMKVIMGMLILSTVTMLLFVVWLYLTELFKALNWPLDYGSALFLVWNNAITGILCILWKGPLLLQQAYLVFNCSLMSLAFIKFLPEWTAWVLLLMISVWDLVAVLCPQGPLRILVETAQARGEDLTKLPALLYSSIIQPILVGSVSGGAKQTFGRDRRLALNITTADGRWPYIELKEWPARPTNVLVPYYTEEDITDYMENGEWAEDLNRSDEARQHGRGDGVLTAPNFRDTIRGRKILQDERENAGSQDMESSSLSANGNDEETYKTLDGEEGSGKIGKEDGSENKEEKDEGGKEETVVGVREGDTSSSYARTSEESKVRGAKLGLGDFVFYSVLIGKAAKTGDWAVILACISAILVGLGLTLVLLITCKKALPALPISITLGLVMYFGFYYITSPFLQQLSYSNVFL